MAGSTAGTMAPTPGATHLTIRTKMLLLIGLPTLTIYVGVLGLTLQRLRVANRAEMEASITQRAISDAARFDAAFREIATIAITTARFIEIDPDLPLGNLEELLRSNLRINPAVYGSACAFEPESPGDDLLCPYVYRRSDGALVTMNIGRDVYDWHADPQWDWYHTPKRTGSPSWSAPYFDDGAGDALMVTYSVPFKQDGAFRGVMTVDIDITHLRDTVGGSIVGDLDFVILTPEGHFVYNRNPEAVMSETVFDVAEAIGRPDIAEAYRNIVSGEPGLTTLAGWRGAPPAGWEQWTETQWVFSAPIGSTGWVVATMMPESRVLAAVRSRMAMATGALALTLLLILASVWFVSGRLVRPIKRLHGAVGEIAGGNLDARVTGIDTNDEVGELADAFNAMAADLRSHLDNLAAAEAHRAKVEGDLELARTIQRSLLPATLPNAPGFDIAGWNLAADQTGGDYYDWLELPGGQTIFTLADVTGHGIGPALIVAACRAYMRASTSLGAAELADAVLRVNDLLFADIPSGRFVTAAVGVLDPASCSMTLISAGQAPILFYEAASGVLHCWHADGLPLGIMAGAPFDAPRTICFAPGDVLLLTTDGFMEWPDGAGRQFGIDGLDAFLREHHTMEAEAMIEALHTRVLAHAGGVAQGDDLTALVIRRLARDA
jgi:sigma-B regulation protein RsbU (phosphoserine phosphatase)